MAQIYAVTGRSKNRKTQTAEMNARLANLPTMLAQKSQQEYNIASIENMKATQELETKRFGLEEGKLGLAEKEYGLSQKRIGLEEAGLEQSQKEFGYTQSQNKKSLELAKSSEQKQMGVKAAGLGFTALGTGGGLTLGGLTSKIGGMWDNLFNKTRVDPEASMVAGTSKPLAAGNQIKTGGINDINIGATAGGGLIGAGAGQILGGKNKLMKSGIGLAAGGLAGFFGSGGDIYSGIGAGILGGLGGLF